jgi:hypothetical protein
MGISAIHLVKTLICTAFSGIGIAVIPYCRLFQGSYLAEESHARTFQLFFNQWHKFRVLISRKPDFKSSK